MPSKAQAGGMMDAEKAVQLARLLRMLIWYRLPFRVRRVIARHCEGDDDFQERAEVMNRKTCVLGRMLLLWKNRDGEARQWARCRRVEKV
jgi:hypothetical protein